MGDPANTRDYPYKNPDPTDFQVTAQGRKEALYRAHDEGLPDASRPASGPFYKNNLGDYLHPKKSPTSGDSNDLAPGTGRASKSPLEKYLDPGQDTVPHEGTPDTRRGLEQEIDNNPNPSNTQY